ncbi:stationary phase survival protein SurE [Rhodopirellula maiorica SM1]|uniref:5'-nucleotidase n=1 Tax=Rhodopirellula maiorica SM1 TaxID=1265738 RepID=M5RTL0_9BACT|nr:5'/3'-nucleotidase SurE [Rhodopirellula maiorica]EMI18722.1 stationary phase survival protein SurE [Rhodopirellula maiorica SM1]
MKLLITNDDGIDAPGLTALVESVFHALGDNVNVIVVAPDRGRSECGHSVTTGRPLAVKSVRPDWFQIDGTPVDCVRAGLGVLAKGADAVLSGVNAGANLGVDLHVSGTFAAAREAAISGVPALALSHYRRPDIERTWAHVPRWTKETIKEFLHTASEQQDSPLLWNLNLPAIDPEIEQPPRVRCDVDWEPMIRTAHHRQSEIHFESDFHSRPRKPGLDVEQCFGGAITLSDIRLDRHLG